MASTYVTSFTRDFKRLGEVAVPKTHPGFALLELVEPVSTFEPGSSITLHTFDDTDAIQLHWGFFAVNDSVNAIDNISLKCELVDSEDCVIESSESNEVVPSGGGKVVKNAFYGLRKGQLRGARMRFSLAVYRPAKFYRVDKKASVR